MRSKRTRSRKSSKGVAKSTKNYVRKAIVKAEKANDVKYNFYYDNNTSLVNGVPYQDTGAYVINLCQLGLGTGDGTRVGSQIHINWLKFNYMISAYNIAGNMASICGMFRIIVFQDMGQQGATPVIQDFFYPTGSGLNQATTNSHNLMVAEYSHNYGPKPNDNRSKRFRVYYDKVFTVGEANGPHEIIHVKKTLKFKKPLICNYIGTASSTASMGPGSLFIFVIPGVSTAIANNPFYQGYVEMQFTD